MAKAKKSGNKKAAGDSDYSWIADECKRTGLSIETVSLAAGVPFLETAIAEGTLSEIQVAKLKNAFATRPNK